MKSEVSDYGEIESIIKAQTARVGNHQPEVIYISPTKAKSCPEMSTLNSESTVLCRSDTAQ